MCHSCLRRRPHNDDYLRTTCKLCAPLFLLLVLLVQWIQEIKAVRNVAPCRISRWAAARMGTAIGIAVGISVVMTAIISVMVYVFAFYRLRRFRSRHRREQSRAREVPDTSSSTPQQLSDLVRLKKELRGRGAGRSSSKWGQA